jgi:hypothetical protein
MRTAKEVPALKHTRHIKNISQRTACAQDFGLGQILVVVAQILGVIGQALAAKDAGQDIDLT